MALKKLKKYQTAGIYRPPEYEKHDKANVVDIQNTGYIGGYYRPLTETVYMGITPLFY